MTLVAKDTKWIVPVVLHSAQMASDLDYLNQLVKPVASQKAPEYRLDGVSLQFAKSVQFTSTPITLLLDHDWKIVWSHIGILDGNDSQEALRSVGF